MNAFRRPIRHFQTLKLYRDFFMFIHRDFQKNRDIILYLKSPAKRKNNVEMLTNIAFR